MFHYLLNCIYLSVRMPQVQRINIFSVIFSGINMLTKYSHNATYREVSECVGPCGPQSQCQSVSEFFCHSNYLMGGTHGRKDLLWF